MSSSTSGRPSPAGALSVTGPSSPDRFIRNSSRRAPRTSTRVATKTESVQAWRATSSFSSSIQSSRCTSRSVT